MLHIYWQITGLKRCAPVVIAQKRENAACYPFEPVHIVSKPRTHFLRRFWFRQLRDKPWQISDAELSELLTVLGETRARLLHIYFGHIGVHLLQRARTVPALSYADHSPPREVLARHLPKRSA